MIKGSATERFIRVLSVVSADILGLECNVAIAARNALENPTPANIVKVQEALVDITESERERIMRETHSQLRNDIEAIWDQLPYAKKATRSI